MTRGFLLGKFMPPHRGHMMLCDFASSYCDSLTILVCTRDIERIDGGLRAAWMREMFPAARVVHFDAEAPQEPADHPDFWRIWHDIVRQAHPEPIDFVFASESYGARLSQEVGARFVPFDPGRDAAPISASRIRQDPYANWQFLPAPVRAHYVKTVCLFGPESTGKTTVSRKLAQALGTVAAPEYGRIYCEIFGTDCDADDLLRIARGQRALEHAARRQANRILVLDTDVLMTAIWSQMLLGRRIVALDETPAADFYLLFDIDIGWTDDGTRYFPDDKNRRRFFELCRNRLEERNLPYALVSGEGEARFAAALAAIAAQFPAIVHP